MGELWKKGPFFKQAFGDGRLLGWQFINSRRTDHNNIDGYSLTNPNGSVDLNRLKPEGVNIIAKAIRRYQYFEDKIRKKKLYVDAPEITVLDHNRVGNWAFLGTAISEYPNEDIVLRIIRPGLQDEWFAGKLKNLIVGVDADKNTAFIIAKKNDGITRPRDDLSEEIS